MALPLVDEELLELEELDELLLEEDELELLLDDELEELEELLLDEELELDEVEEELMPPIEPVEAVSVTRSSLEPSSRRWIRNVCEPAAMLLKVVRFSVE
jgi:hypothetical protein